MHDETVNEDMVFDRVNYLLEGSRLPYDIRDLDELEQFVQNKSNKRLGVYREIKGLYNEISGSSSHDGLYAD